MIGFINSLPSTVVLGLIWGIMAIGVFITFKVLDIADLTVDGSLATGSVVCTVLVTSGVNVWLAMFIAFLTGAVAGFVTGFFHTVFGIPAILSGILTQLMLYSINLKIGSNRSNISLNPDYFNTAFTLRNLNHTILLIIITLVLLVALLYMFFGTEFGSAIRATGKNEKMSKALGINVNFNKVVGLMLSNGLVAFSGSVLAQYNGYSDINMGRGAIVIGLAAIIIGLAILSLFKKLARNFACKLVACLVGAVIYFLVYQFVIFLDVDTNLLKMFSALVVALFLGIPYLRKKIANSPLFKKKKEDKTNA